VIAAVLAFLIGQLALMWRRHKRRQARRDSR
jgi:nitrate reductase gamma subunit